jgi:hypothetical protein
MMPIDVYRIGTRPHWVERLHGWVAARPTAHWATLTVLAGFPIRKTGGHWIGPRWQAEWPGCERAVRGWTESGARRKAIAALT